MPVFTENVPKIERNKKTSGKVQNSTNIFSKQNI